MPGFRGGVDPSAFVPTTRQVIAGAGMTGGGPLTADVTLNVGANPDGSIVVNPDDIQVGVLATDAQHGLRGGGALHALVVAAGAAGFMSGADKSKLDLFGPASDYVRRDGTTALTADWGLGAFRLRNLAAAALGSDAARLDQVTAAQAGAVPTGRTVTGTAPVRIDGDNAAHDLSANRTWSLNLAASLTVSGGALAVVYGTGANTALEGTNDGLYVHLAGPETITGVKSFGASPVINTGFKLLGQTALTLEAQGATNKVVARANGADVAQFNHLGGIDVGAQAIANPVANTVQVSNNVSFSSRTAGASFRSILALINTADQISLGNGTSLLFLDMPADSVWNVAGNRAVQWKNPGGATTLILGNFEGVTAQPAAVTVRAPNTASGGGNTNLAGGPITMAAGLGTGNAQASDVELAGSLPTGTGTTAQTLVTNLRAREPGADTEVGIFVRVNRATVRSLDRVSIGAVDSGGVGFRVMRVPN